MDMIVEFQALIIALLIIGFLTFFILIFRRNIASVIDRIQSVDYSKGSGENQTAVALSTFGYTPNSIPHKKDNSIADQESSKVDSVEDSKPGKEYVSPSELEARFFALLEESQTSEAEELYSKTIESLSGNRERVDIKLSYAFWRVYFGHDSSLTRMESAVESAKEFDDLLSKGKRLLGWLLLKRGRQTEALSSLQYSYDHGTSDMQKAQAATISADIICEIEGSEKATQYLSDRVQSLTSHDAIGLLFSKIAEILNDIDSNRSSLAREVSLAYSGKSRANLFDLAYKSKSLLVQLHYYQELLTLDPENNMAHNNLGVTYKELGHVFSSVEQYRRAEKLGETLSAANLAFLFINNGFEEEARELISWAQSEENTHQNVGNAQYALQSSIDAELEAVSLHRKAAARRSNFFLEHGSKFFFPAQVHDYCKPWICNNEGAPKLDISQGPESMIFEMAYSTQRYSGHTKNIASGITLKLSLENSTILTDRPIELSVALSEAGNELYALVIENDFGCNGWLFRTVSKNKTVAQIPEQTT